MSKAPLWISGFICIAIVLIPWFAGEQHQDNLRLEAKHIMKNRQTYAKEIITATNDCIKSSASIKTLTAASNDQAETVDECSKFAQQTYGAYSPYGEGIITEAAVR
jgi:hypothetical protein